MGKRKTLWAISLCFERDEISQLQVKLNASMDLKCCWLGESPTNLIYESVENIMTCFGIVQA